MKDYFRLRNKLDEPVKLILSGVCSDCRQGIEDLSYLKDHKE
ncbi:MAG: hypothetical protein PVJ19_22515 [Desulfobacteraceae bacterium]